MPRIQITSQKLQAQLDAACSIEEMRSAGERAVDSLRVWEVMAQGYQFEDGQECPWCLYKKGATYDDGTPFEHSRNCPFSPENGGS